MTKEQWRKREEQWKRFHEWERQELSQSKLSSQDAFRIFDDLYEEARALGALRKPGDFGDLEPRLRIAAMINRSGR